MATLLGTGTASSEEVVVHLVGGRDSSFMDCLKACGVKVKFAEPYGDPRAIGCNRLVQLDTPELLEADYIVLLDTDLALTKNLRKAFTVPGVSAKPVDIANPPLPILKNLLRESGIDAAPTIVECTYAPAETFSTNCNGGVLIFDALSFRGIGTGWRKWAAWVLEQEAILGRYLLHTVQISLCLAMLEQGSEVSQLDAGMNFATHLDLSCYRPEHNISPAIIHYHAKLDSQGMIEGMGLSEVDNAVNAVNSMIADYRGQVPDGPVLEQFRRKYHSPPIVSPDVGTNDAKILEKIRRRAASIGRIMRRWM
jgi:hypothetical protein